MNQIYEDFARDYICPENPVKDQLEILNNSKPSGPVVLHPGSYGVSQCLVSPLTLLFNQANVDNFHIFAHT